MKRTKRTSTIAYIKKLKWEAAKYVEHKTRNTIKFWVFTVLMVALCAGGIYYGFFQRDTGVKNLYSEYAVTLDNSLLTQDLLSYQDTYKLFQENKLGNNNSVIQSGGYFASSDGISVYPSEDGAYSIISINGKAKAVIEGLASYVNIWEGKIVYRLNQNRSILIYDKDKNSSDALITGNIGEVLVFDGICFYIDFNDDSHLKCVSLFNRAQESLINESVISFAIAGKTVYYLNSNHNLKVYNLQTKAIMQLCSNVQDFNCDNGFWIESNGKIYQADFSCRQLKEIPLTANEQISNHLIGANSANVFYSNSSNVYIYSIKDGSVKHIFDGIVVAISDIESKCLFVYDENAGYSIFKLMQ